MNIEAIINMLKMLKSFTELLKTDMTLETLTTIREIKGSDVLENYEKMFEVDGPGTKNVLKNYIINEINSLSTGYMEIAKYDNNELKTFVKDKLEIVNIDLNKLNFIISKSEDEEAFSLIKHKLSLLTYFEKLASNSKYIEVMNTDESLKVLLEDIIKKHDTILTIIAKTLEGNDIIKFDITGEVYGFGFGEEEDSELDIKEYLLTLKNNLDKVSSKVETVIKNIKDNIDKVDYKTSLANDIRNDFMKIIDEYCKGIITTDMFELQYRNQLEVMEFYVNTVLAYVNSLVSYIEYVKEYTITINDVDNIINVSYDLFNKSE